MKKGTFIAIGNAHQPFPRFFNLIQDLKDQLPRPIVIQSGVNNISLDNCEVRSFLSITEFQFLMNSSEVLIGHAGTGFIYNAIMASKKPFVMPRRFCYGEHVNDHQLELVARLERMSLIFSLESISDYESRKIFNSNFCNSERKREKPRILELLNRALIKNNWS